MVVAAAVLLAALGAVADAAPGGATTARSAASTTLAALGGGHFSQICALAPPGEVSACQGDLKELAAARPAYTNLSLGVVTVRGTRAVFAFTGRVCATAGKRQCFSNADANVALDHKKSFNQVYSTAAGGSSSSPFIVPLVEHGGRWYVAGF